MVRIESGTAVLKMQAENLSEMFYSVNTVFKHRIFCNAKKNRVEIQFCFHTVFT